MTTSPNAFDPPEIIITQDHHVACDGGGGALGHPIVWYEMGDAPFVECKYCDRRFVRKGGPEDPEVKAASEA